MTADFPGWTIWQAADGRWYATRNAVPAVFPATLDALSENELHKKLTAQQRKETRRG
ncbi:hypothetical protein AB0B89_29260 [Sphaerisporangium sp. NPDC049002]|uniref:hypothetical protein n=1 Tax=Sphaerisporangium sp. NPDC049002 TaxID=3155392 RepID=UPI0033C0B313